MATLAARIDALAAAIRDKINLLSGRIDGIRVGTTVLGYGTGAGGTVTQATSKATAVTSNKLSGEITMNAAALLAATIVTFVFNNSTVAVGDQIVCTHHSGGTFGAYAINARVTGAGAVSVAVRNNSAASLSEAIVIKFNVIKSAIT
jgi:cell shape-determining protein MreC